jgi:RNA polymerase sigma factor (sigma-70 family)
MDDRGAVAAIVAGDTAGLVDVYDHYAAALYGYCRALLRDPQDAADAVQDTFVITAARVSALRDPGKLRPWLYAVARNECHRKLRSPEATADADDGDTGYDWARTADAQTDPRTAPQTAAQLAQQAELRELVDEALAGLNPSDRDVIELNQRHELEGGELAAVLGVSRRQAHGAVSHARVQLDKSLGALLVARSGRRSCAGLDEILAGWDGQLSPLPRRRVNRHIERCGTCGDRKRRMLRPAMLYGFAPLPPLPPRLRHQVMALCSDDSPDAMEFKRDVARDAGRFGPDGFPRPLVRGGRRRLSEPGSALVAAASVAAAAIVIIAMIALRGSPSLRTVDDNRPSGGPGSAAATSANTFASPSLISATPSTAAGSSTAAGIIPAAPPSSASSTPKPKKSPKPTPKASPSTSPAPSLTSTPPRSPSAPPPSTVPPTTPPTTTPPTTTPPTTTPPTTTATTGSDQADLP